MNPFQLLVDWSQRQPHWWGRQVSSLAILLILALVWFEPRPWKHPIGFVFWISFQALSSYGDWQIANDPDQWELIHSRMTPIWLVIAWFPLALASVHVVLGVVPLDSSEASFLVYALSIGLFASFLWCKPPAPPKPKSRALKVAT